MTQASNSEWKPFSFNHLQLISAKAGFCFGNKLIEKTIAGKSTSGYTPEFTNQQGTVMKLGEREQLNDIKIVQAELNLGAKLVDPDTGDVYGYSKKDNAFVKVA